MYVIEGNVSKKGHADRDFQSEFVRSVLAKNDGIPYEAKRPSSRLYSPFRPSIAEHPLTNPPIEFAHISHGFEAHEKALGGYWQPKGVSFTKGERTFMKTHRINEGIYKEVSEPTQLHTPFESEYGKAGMKVFGRKRELKPFTRAKLYTRPANRTPHKINIDEEAMDMIARLRQRDLFPDYTNPHPDPWKTSSQSVCGVKNISSSFANCGRDKLNHIKEHFEILNTYAAPKRLQPSSRARRNPGEPVGAHVEDIGLAPTDPRFPVNIPSPCDRGGSYTAGLDRSSSTSTFRRVDSSQTWPGPRDAPLGTQESFGRVGTSISSIPCSRQGGRKSGRHGSRRPGISFTQAPSIDDLPTPVPNPRAASVYRRAQLADGSYVVYEVERNREIVLPPGAHWDLSWNTYEEYAEGTQADALSVEPFLSQRLAYTTYTEQMMGHVKPREVAGAHLLSASSELDVPYSHPNIALRIETTSPVGPVESTSIDIHSSASESSPYLKSMPHSLAEDTTLSSVVVQPAPVKGLRWASPVSRGKKYTDFDTRSGTGSSAAASDLATPPITGPGIFSPPRYLFQMGGEMPQSSLERAKPSAADALNKRALGMKQFRDNKTPSFDGRQISPSMILNDVLMGDREVHEREQYEIMKAIKAKNKFDALGAVKCRTESTVNSRMVKDLSKSSASLLNKVKIA